MTEYGRSGLPLEYEKEMEKIMTTYFEDENIQEDMEEYFNKHASSELKKARRKRNKYYAKMKKKGIIIN